MEPIWDGLCTVLVREPETDPKTGRAAERERVLFEKIPCHLCYYYYLHHGTDREVSGIYQRAAVYLERDREVPFGSKIRVTQNGKTAEYSLSGAPVVYAHHREVPVARFERWV